MMSRIQPIHVFRLACIFLIVVVGHLAAVSAIAQAYDWLVSEGPEGGEVFALAQAPNGDVYAGTWGIGGIYRSTDQGLSWQEVGLQGKTISEVVINIAGTVFAALSTGDVHRSVDNGSTWPLSGSGIVAHWGALAYDPVLDILYAARSEEVSRSLDGGDSWQIVDTDFPEVNVRAMATFPNGGPLFVGTDMHKVIASEDGGVTWVSFSSGIDVNRVDDFLVIPGLVIYAATYGGGIYRAQLGDASWTRMSQGIGDGFCLTIGRDPGGSLWAGTAGDGTYVSHNDGVNWAAAQVGLERKSIYDLLFLGDSNFLAGCYGGGVFRTDNWGATWTPSSSGMNRTNIQALWKTGTDDLFSATGGAGVHRSTDGGLTWDSVNDGIVDPQVLDIVSHPDGDIFCATWDTYIYRSTDGGDTWSRSGSGPNILGAGCLAVKPSSGDLFVGGLYEGGVWRSPDKGDSWYPANTGITDFDLIQLVVEDDGDLLVVTRYAGIFRSEDDGVSWFPLNNGFPELNVYEVLSLPGGVLFAVVHPSGLYQSMDDGASWNLVHSSLPGIQINCVAANPNGFIFTGSNYDGIVYQSIDGGDSWLEISGWFPTVSLKCLAFNAAGHLLAGTNGIGVIYTDESTPVQLREFTAERAAAGSVTVRWTILDEVPFLAADVFRSTAGTAREQVSWGVLTGDPIFEFVDTAAPADACEYWLRLTDAAGVHSWYGPKSVDKADLFLSGLAIESVWPNPASGSTTIRYAVPGGQPATLDVYDVAGRLVRRLRHEAGGSGTLEAIWDARDDRGSRVASGTYFLRLQTGIRMVTGKVVVLGDQR